MLSNISVAYALWANLLFCAASFVLGKIVLSGIEFKRPLTALLIKFLLGLDLICLAGLLFGNKIDSNFLILFILLLALSWPLRRKNPPKWNSRSLCNLSLLPLLIIAILIMGRALCPPTGWDELVYQLAVPLRWLEGRGTEIFPDNPYSAFPSLSGMAFRILIANGGLLSPRIFVFLLWAAACLAVYSVISPGSSKIAKIAIMTAFSASFPVLMAGSSAYSEFFIVANFAGALVLAFEKKSFDRKNGIICLALICGILAGAAASVKMTGLVVVPSVCLLLLYPAIPKWRNWAKFFVFFAAAGFFSAVFYLRPYLLTGNPFYPYFAPLFTGEKSLIEMSSYHHAAGSLKYGLGGISEFLLSPVLLCFFSDSFDGYLGFQFFPILVIAVVLFMKNFKNKDFFSFRFQCLFVSSLLYCFWYISSRQSRFLIPCAMALAAAVAPYLSRIKYSRSISILIISLTIFSIPPKFAKDCLISWNCVLGNVRKIDYLYSSTGPGYIKACDILRNETIKDKKIMMIFENRGLYVPPDHIIATPFFQGLYFTPPDEIGRKDIADVIIRERITHLLVGLSPSDPDRIPEYLDRSAKFANALGELADEGFLSKIWEDEGYAVFRINPK